MGRDIAVAGGKAGVYLRHQLQPGQPCRACDSVIWPMSRSVIHFEPCGDYSLTHVSACMMACFQMMQTTSQLGYEVALGRNAQLDAENIFAIEGCLGLSFKG